MPRQVARDLDNQSLKVHAKGGSAHIEELTIHEIQSIWPSTGL